MIYDHSDESFSFLFFFLWFIEGTDCSSIELNDDNDDNDDESSIFCFFFIGSSWFEKPFNVEDFIDNEFDCMFADEWLLFFVVVNNTGVQLVGLVITSVLFYAEIINQLIVIRVYQKFVSRHLKNLVGSGEMNISYCSAFRGAWNFERPRVSLLIEDYTFISIYTYVDIHKMIRNSMYMTL